MSKIPKINTSTEYNLFSTILGNRLVSQKKTDNIVSDIKKGLNLLPFCPILVFEKEGQFKIVDGQHRFNAAKKLELPVYYILCEEMDLKYIAQLNSRSDKWKNSDFLECYIQLGIKDYEVLLDFIKEYKLIYSAAVDLLMSGVPRGGGVENMEKFRNGAFKVNFFEESKQIVELTAEIFDRYVFYNDRCLIGAVQELQKAGVCDFEHLKTKISEAPNIMDKKSSIKEYKYLIEQVYNFKNTKRIALF